MESIAAAATNRGEHQPCTQLQEMVIIHINNEHTHAQAKKGHASRQHDVTTWSKRGVETVLAHWNNRGHFMGGD